MKRKPMHIVFWATVIGLFCAFIVGVVVAYGKLLQDEHSGTRADETLNTGKQTFEGVTNLNFKADSSLSEIQILKQEIVVLNDQLKPFKELAKSRYPTLNEEEGLDKLKEHVVELENKTAKLENRASDLEKKTQPRTLTKDQTKVLNAELKTSKFPIFITSKFMDSESFQFAEQIYNVIKNTNNDVFLSKAKTTLVEFSGVGICSFPAGAYSEGENLLVQAFKKAEIFAKRVIFPASKMAEQPNMNCIIIVVGEK